MYDSKFIGLIKFLAIYQTLYQTTLVKNNQSPDIR